MKVIVTGAAGHLGAAMVEEFASAHDVAPLGRLELDIADRVGVARALKAFAPDAVINCAAYTDVDAAQDHPVQALEINALGVMALARAAAECGAALVHFSTDFVFNGRTDRPYVETDEPCPESFYGCSKLLGEYLAEDAPRHYVLRVASIFGGPTAGATARDGSLGTIVRMLKDGKEIAVFTDRTASPSYAPDIASATRALLERRLPCGLYHCVNSGAATWHEIAAEAAAVLGVAARLKPITLDGMTLAAPRPKYSALNPGKLEALGIPMRSWQDAVRDWLHGGQSVRPSDRRLHEIRGHVPDRET